MTDAKAALPRNAVVAGGLALLLGPFAMIYCGRLRRGMLWWVVNVVLAVIAIGSILIAPGRGSLVLALSAIAVLWISLCCDAIWCAKNPPSSQRAYQSWRGYAVALPLLIGANLISTGLVRAYVAESFFLPTRGMETTLLAGDRFIVDKMSLRFRELSHGDVVVFRTDEPGMPVFVQRVIGLPGDTIELANEQLIVNGKQVEEPYRNLEGRLPPAGVLPELTNFGPHVVSPGSVFLLGDRRRLSSDSRSRGDTPDRDILGIVRMVSWSRIYSYLGPPLPFSKDPPSEEWGPVRWERIGTHRFL